MMEVYLWSLNRYQNVPTQKIVVVKVSYSGVCGTDLAIISGRFPAAKKLIQGHEFAGIISEVGAKVNHLKVGDR